MFLLRWFIGKKTGIELERRENDARAVLDAVQDIRPLGADRSTKLMITSISMVWDFKVEYDVLTKDENRE
jgi:hypothetical protein